MNHDPLHELLHAVDAGHQPFVIESKALAQAVRRRARRRQVRRRGALVVSLVLVGLALWREVTVHRLLEHSVGAPEAIAHQAAPLDAKVQQAAVDREFYTAEIARLNAEIEQNRQTIKLLQAMQKLEQQSHEQPRVTQAIYRRPAEDFDSMEELVADRLDTAARISVQRADTLAGEFERYDEAAEAYRAVIKYFPQSRWATVAQERIEQLPTKQLPTTN